MTLGETERDAGSWNATGGQWFRVRLIEISDTFLIKAGPKHEVLAMNSVANPCSPASPAISDGMIFIRGEKHSSVSQRKQRDRRLEDSDVRKSRK